MEATMCELAKLIDVIIWPLIVISLLIISRKYVVDILNMTRENIRKGAGFSAGPAGIKLEKLESRVEEQSRRIDQITVGTESTLQSLASLVIADPLKIPAYMQRVEKRLISNKTIIVGCQDYTEQRILCAIISKLLEREAERNSDAGFQKIIPKYDFGGANLNFIALSRGDIDIYPAYTWQGFEMAYATALPQSVSELVTLTPGGALRRLNEIFEDLPSPLTWLCCTGFCNNWKMVMRKEDANKTTKISQLRELNNTLVVGCEHDFFARPNGYSRLTSPFPDGYGLSFKDISLFRHTEAYSALDKLEVDVIDGFTTDPQIQDTVKYQPLEDDETMFGNYCSSIVARKQLIDTYPAIGKALMLLEDTITDSEMSQMIKAAERYSIVNEREQHLLSVENIASRFLNDKNLADMT